MNSISDILNQNPNLLKELMAKLIIFDNSGNFVTSSDDDFTADAIITIMKSSQETLLFPCTEKTNAFVFIGDRRYSASVTPLGDGGCAALIYDDRCFMNMLSNGAISENVSAVIKDMREDVMAINTGLDAIGFVLEDQEMYDQLEYLTSPLESCVSVLGSMNDISELSYYAKGDVAAAALDASEILENICADLAKRLAKSNIRLSFSIDKNAVVITNANRFIAVLMLLLTRAIRRLCGMGDREISIALSKSGDNALLSVSAKNALSADNAPSKRAGDISDMVITSFCNSYNAMMFEAENGTDFTCSLRLKITNDKALLTFRDSYVDSRFSVYNTYLHKILSDK